MGLNHLASEASENFETTIITSLENAPSVKNSPLYCEREYEMRDFSEKFRALGIKISKTALL